MSQDTHPALASNPVAEQAIEAFLGGIAAVDPTVLVRTAVRQGRLDDWLFEGGARRDQPHWLQVLALGKAAPRMLWGLVEAGVPFQGLGAAPPGVPAPTVDTFRWHQGDHPVPGPKSFAAGKALLEWADAFPEGEPLLVLLSGGASACAEVPLEGTPEELAAKWEALLREGLPIEETNLRRAAWSALKDGRLGKRLLERTKHIRVWVLADTDPATAPQAVGSGPFNTGGIPHHVIASSNELVAAAGLRLGAAGWSVYRFPERISGDTEAEARRFVDAFHRLEGPSVALVGGGEPLLRVPADAPKGGRCPHSALAAAGHLREGEAFLAAASDGVDGSSGATGAWAVAEDADPAALQSFAAFQALKAKGRTFGLGATGTNVNDLWVALRP
ncbi:MAG: glycerate 2-kinase [Thermoplasmata archaeon]|jgi:hydroxypyruvate reductase|nr:glycerate 2-kinase [Thermoplasmata archaeon]